MANQDIQKEPKLYFPNLKGEYEAEYIPPNYLNITNWFRWKYITLRSKYGKDIYYWNFRYLHYPDFRKTADIEFILHVIKDHDYKPSEKSEKKHFEKAWKLYGTELQYVLEALNKDKSKDMENNEVAHSYHYAHAYKDKWFPKRTEADTKLIYHGVKFYEMANYFEQSIEEETIRLKAYFVEHGLDPDTGKKAKQSSDD